MHGYCKPGTDTRLDFEWRIKTAIASIIVTSSSFVSSEPVFVKSIIFASALCKSFIHSSELRSSVAYLSVITALSKCKADWIVGVLASIDGSCTDFVAISLIAPVVKYKIVGRICNAPEI